MAYLKSVILPAVESGHSSPIGEIPFEDYIPLSKVVGAFPFDGLFGQHVRTQGGGSAHTDTASRRPYAEGEHTNTIQPKDGGTLSVEALLQAVADFPKTRLEPLEVRVVNPGVTGKKDGFHVRRIDYETTWTYGQIIIKLVLDKAGRSAEYTISFQERPK